MKFSARITAWIVVFFVFVCLTPISFAQSNSTTNKNPNLIRDNVDSNVPNTLHNWTQTVMIETLSSFSCQLTGIDPINPKQPCLGVDQQTNKIGFLPSPQTGGVLGFMGNMIAVLYTPPAHTSDYLQDLAQNFGISKKTYAANTGGTGFQSIASLIGIWSVFRNIVYLLLVLIFVIIGLAIMLRIKIDPRTVMTIQNQIPKIIIGIIAITFSFAIAGFLIDLMWILIYLLYNILSPVVNLGTLNPVNLQSTNPFSASGSLNVASIALSAAMGGVGGFIQSLFPGADTTYGQIIQLILTTGPGVLIFNPMFYSSLGGIIALIIITIALCTALFRLWFSLIKAYVQILLDIVLAPFWIIGGMIPGSQISLGGWLKDLAANILAFPVVIAMFMLGKAFMDIFGNTSTAGQIFVPPLIGNPVEPTVIGSLISLGILLMTPNVISMLKAMIKSPKMETGLGKSISGATGVASRTGQSIISAGSTAIMGDPFNPSQKGIGAIFRGWQRKH